LRKILLLALVAWASPCSAQFVDGNRALRECEADDKSSIDFFIAGVADTSTNDKQALVAKSLQFSMGTTPVPADLTRGILREMHTFCLKQPADWTQIRDTVCSYLKSSSKLSQSAAKLATEALQAAYPCKP
jgi:hypothetical protein